MVEAIDWMKPYYEAAKGEIEEEAAKRKQRTLEDLARRGVRTSGISEYPLSAIASDVQKRLATLSGTLAREKAIKDWQEQQAEKQRQFTSAEAEKQRQYQEKQSKILREWQAQQRELERQWQAELQREMWQRQLDWYKEQARKQQEAQWWNLGLSVLGGALTGGLGLIPGIAGGLLGGLKGAGLGATLGPGYLTQSMLMSDYLNRLGYGLGGSTGMLPPSLSLY